MLIDYTPTENVIARCYPDYLTYSTRYQISRRVRFAVFYSMYIFSKLSNDVKTYDESAGNMTATAMSGGMIALIGFGGLILGGALGAVITVLINKKKKETVQ